MKWSMIFCALLTFACSDAPRRGTPRDASVEEPEPVLYRLQIVEGANQRGVPGTALAKPLVVRVVDQHGAPQPMVKIGWSGATVAPASLLSDAMGRASAICTVPVAFGPFSVTARVGEVRVELAEEAVHGLVYANPAAGRIQLIATASSTPEEVSLAFVAKEELTGLSAGLTLPLAADTVALPLDGYQPGDALDLGPPPFASRAALVTTGSLAGHLVVGVSGKSSADATIAAGAVFFELRLSVANEMMTPQTIFDGAALGHTFSAGLRDRAGNEIVAAREVGIGKLELR